MNSRNAAALRDFIQKWEPLFCRENRMPEDSAFAADCEALGFAMDCGDSLRKRFPGVDPFRAAVLRGRIGAIDDVRLLGSALFSRWRYLTHWLQAPPPEDAREWFALIFLRLSELATGR